MSQINFIDSLYEKVFSDQMQKKFESFILFAATIGFIIHLSLIGFNYFKILDFGSFEGTLLTNPISAIYTPFSFILVYEIYLLLLYLPRSFSTSISKQFEIVSLIVIRKIFKDIPSMDFSENWFNSHINLELLINLIGVLIIFYLIFLFKLNKKRAPIKTSEINLKSFIRSKKIVMDDGFYDGVGEKAMEKAQDAKYSQNKDLENMLILTKNAKIQKSGGGKSRGGN